MGDLIILEAFPAYTFEDLHDMIPNDWQKMYAKARVMLEYIRRSPIVTEDGSVTTISDYIHLADLGLFDDEDTILAQQEQIKTKSKASSFTAHAVNGSTGESQQIPLSAAMERVGETGIGYEDPGMSTKTRR